VIDMDAIRLELGIGVDQWGQDTLIRSLRRRNELLAALATARQGSAWFIVSEARAQERDWWRHMLHPQQTVIVLASADTCMDRIRSTRTGDRADRAIRAARRWWDNYSPAAHELEVHTDQ
jgi:5-methylcytosine-specific restriction protein A